MIEVFSPATSANLGCGFDTLGLALDLYNSFKFEPSSKDDISSFNPEYRENNLILYSYKSFFTKAKIEYIPVKVIPSKNDIPTSRGLGSSATAIVAGILAANHFSKANKSTKWMIELATEIEGHPDNVSPAILGGFVASLKVDDNILTFEYEISAKLDFYIFVSNQVLKTEDSRKVLPNSYSRSDVIYNISRIVNLPLALKNGDINLIKELTNDKIHEPYRSQIIDQYNIIKVNFENEFSKVLISGSGSTLLMICDKKNYKLPKKNIEDIRIVKLNVSKRGGYVNEI